MTLASLFQLPLYFEAGFATTGFVAQPLQRQVGSNLSGIYTGDFTERCRWAISAWRFQLGQDKYLTWLQIAPLGDFA